MRNARHWYAALAGLGLHQDCRTASSLVLTGLGAAEPVWLECSHVWIGEPLLACATAGADGLLRVEALYARDSWGRPSQIAGARDILLDGATVEDLAEEFLDGRSYARAIQQRVFGSLSLAELVECSGAMERWQDAVQQAIWRARAGWAESIRLADELWAAADLPADLRGRDVTCGAKKPSDKGRGLEWNFDGYPGVMLAPKSS